jgi:fructokinase
MQLNEVLTHLLLLGAQLAVVTRSGDGMLLDESSLRAIGQRAARVAGITTSLGRKPADTH